MSTQQQQDVWIKWDWLWSAIFYAAVIVSAVMLLLDDDLAMPYWIPLLLTAVLVVWHWAGIKLTLKGEVDWNERARERFLVILVDIVIWFVLVNISAAYYFVLFGLFSQIFRYLPIRFAIVGTLILTAAIIGAEVVDEGQAISLSNPTFWVFLFLAAGGITLGVWISAIIHQSSRRRELIEQLESAQANLAAAERREGVLEERQRLAREIHDTLAQGFTSIVMHLEAADQALPDDTAVVEKHLNQARDTARRSLDEARRVVEDLRPDLLEQRSLVEAIERASTRWSRETSVPVQVTTTGTAVPLHPDIEVTILRATQEALTNIRKHAQATQVILTLSYMGDVVILDVHDDGVGLNGAEPSPYSGGYGLQAMRERAEQLGGSASIESEPGEGTTVVVSVPT